MKGSGTFFRLHVCFVGESGKGRKKVPDPALLDSAPWLSALFSLSPLPHHLGPCVPQRGRTNKYGLSGTRIDRVDKKITIAFKLKVVPRRGLGKGRLEFGLGKYFQGIRVEVVQKSTCAVRHVIGIFLVE